MSTPGAVIGNGPVKVLPFPFITGAYVNSATKTPKNNSGTYQLPFPFITGAYVNKITLMKWLALYLEVTIPFYHGCLCQHHLFALSERIKSTVTIPFYHGCLCQPDPLVWDAVEEIPVTIPFYHGCLCQLNITSGSDSNV